MSAATLTNGLIFFMATAGQVVGASLLPATRGFTHPGFTIACLVSFGIGLFMMARLVVGGINLSIVVPVMTCTVPAGIIAVAVLLYGEPAPLLKIGLLLVAVILIGVASTVS